MYLSLSEMRKMSIKRHMEYFDFRSKFQLDHPVEHHDVGGVGLGQEGVARLAGDARRVEEAVVLRFGEGSIF